MRGMGFDIDWAAGVVKRYTPKLIWTLLVAPWILIAIGFAIARVAFALRNGLRRLRFASAARMICPRGHRTELYGIFECRCGALFAGWAFGRCPICRESCGYVPCEHCSLAVKNPLL